MNDVILDYVIPMREDTQVRDVIQELLTMQCMFTVLGNQREILVDEATARYLLAVMPGRVS